MLVVSLRLSNPSMPRLHVLFQKPYIVQTSSNIVMRNKQGGSGLWERGVAVWSHSLFTIINICTSTL